MSIAFVYFLGYLLISSELLKSTNLKIMLKIRVHDSSAVTVSISGSIEEGILMKSRLKCVSIMENNSCSKGSRPKRNYLNYSFSRADRKMCEAGSHLLKSMGLSREDMLYLLFDYFDKFYRNFAFNF
jgi:hypothetical protein